MSRLSTLAFVFLLSTVGLLPALRAQSTEITYQGQLQSSSAPATGEFDFEFLLFSSAIGGSQIWATVSRNAVAVANGTFSVNLDFGTNFPGATRFIEIRVRQSGGGAFTTLSPRQAVTSAPYSIKSLTADNATNATNAVTATNATASVTAMNFTGSLNGDVTGTQNVTTVARLQSRSVANTAPLDGQVLKYDAATSQWRPDTDNTGTGGGGGTITGVSSGTGLTGGGATGNVTLGIANAGVGNVQLADSSVTNAKIVDVVGSKISGAITIATIPGANVTGAVANATNATNAATAVNFSGPVEGDVTGKQGKTTVKRIRNLPVPVPVQADDGKVLRYKNDGVNPAAFELATVSGGGGGGTITGVTAGTGLTGGGATGTVVVGIANGRVGTTQLTDGSVTTEKIADVTGHKITGSITTATIPGASVTGAVTNATNAINATTAATATNATQLGGVAASQYLQTNGDGSSLTNLNAGSLVTGTLNNSRLGLIPTANIADNAVTAAKIASGQVVKSVNSLTDNVTLAAGSNITITPAGNTLTIAATGGGSPILNQTTQQSGANFNISGNGNAGGTLTAGTISAATQYNIGANRILLANQGSNLFAGIDAGKADPTGIHNVFLGNAAGRLNTSGNLNTFSGSLAGSNNIGGSSNASFGFAAGTVSTGNGNSYFGANAGNGTVSANNSTAIGSYSSISNGVTNATAIGYSSLVAQDNSIVLGSINGVNLSFSDTNVGIGTTTPQGGLHVNRNWNGAYGALNLSGDRPTIRFSGGAVSGNNQWLLHLGSAAGAAPTGSLSFFYGGTTGASFGLPVFAVTPTGTVVVATLGSAGSTAVCRNAANELSSCSSSLRYKDHIAAFAGGLKLVKRLHPIAFTWKQDGLRDIGFGAEQVNSIEPLLTTTNTKGEVEGVKYDRIGVVLVNAVNEQQAQIEAQQKQIDQLFKGNQEMLRLNEAIRIRLTRLERKVKVNGKSAGQRK